MSEDVSKLLAELAAEDAPGRSEERERERRQRVVRAMAGRLVPPARSSRFRWWLLLPAAATIALGVGAVQRASQPSALEMQPERLRPAPKREAPQPTQGPAREEPTFDLPSIASVQRATPSNPGKLAPPPPSSSAALPPAEPSLAAQNELFQSAVRASRHGDDAAALAALDALLAKHPGSVLAADARVRKFRTLVRLGRRDEARAAAQDYLAKHPDGFAAAEARKLIVAEAPSP